MKKQMSFAFVAALLITSVAVAAAADDKNNSNAKDRTLVVMTYNINHATPCVAAQQGPGCDADLDAVVEVIREANAQLVALQEVDRFWARSGMVDQPEYLAKEIGMFYCFAPNIKTEDGSEYGTAILSRLPILECTNLQFKSQGSEVRSLLAAWVNVQGVALLFLNAHLDNGSEGIRADQVAEIMDAIAGVTQPIVLAGDLNALPGEVSLSPLMTEPWQRADTGDTSADAEETQGRIDYIFLKGSAMASAYVIETLPSPSNHWPVRAEVTLPGASVGVGRRK